MAQKVNVPMPQDLDLVSGWSIRVTAVDANGAAVSAVKSSQLSIIADTPNPATADDLAYGTFVVGPPMLVPGPNG